jgi:hypothetical protein
VSFVSLCLSKSFKFHLHNHIHWLKLFIIFPYSVSVFRICSDALILKIDNLDPFLFCFVSLCQSSQLIDFKKILNLFLKNHL